MFDINLLNWRAQRITIENRRFAAVVIIAIIITLFISTLIYLFINAQIAKANSGVAYLDTQLKDVAGIIAEIKTIQEQKNSLLSRRKTIDTLQASRPLDVEIFDNIARIIPQGVVLTQIVRKGDSIILTGESDSNYNVSVLMENAQRLFWVKLAKLGQLKSLDTSNDKNPTSQKIGFEVNLKIDNEKAGIEAGATTGAGTGNAAT